MTASERLKHLLDNKNLSTAQFGKKVGVSRDTLNKMFSKGSDPKLHLLQKCLELFPNLNIEWLILGSGEMWKITEEKTTLLEQEMKEVKSELKRINDRLEKEL